MTSTVQALPAGGAQTKPLWAAVTVLSVAVLALGASLIYIQNRPPDGHAVLATLDAATLSALAYPPAPAVAPVPVTAVASDEFVVTQSAPKPALVKVRPAASRPVTVAPAPIAADTEGTAAALSPVVPQAKVYSTDQL